MSKDRIASRLFKFCMFLVILSLAACSDSEGKIKPFEVGSSPERIFAAEPQLVTFIEIQERPEDFQDQLIRVTGNFFRTEVPQCYPFNGYGAEWMLVGDDLRLDAVGFEQVMRLISDGRLLTVDGFFRLYEGPLGCGKTAPITTAWFLEVVRIVQPNPLVRAGGITSGGGGPGLSSPQATIPGTPIIPPQTQQPSTPTPEASSVPTGTPTPGLTLTVSSTTTASPTGTRLLTGTPTVTTTPPGSVTVTLTPTRTPSPSPTTTLTPAATTTAGPIPTQPPLPTTYPGATETPEPY